jgi:SSS family solute:Na+ symporter
MFWRRTTGHGAFVGLLSGTAAAALHHGLSLPGDAATGIKGGWLAVVKHYPSEMAQNFWTAIWAWTACFLVTIAVSLLTRRQKSDEELRGLVYALTPRTVDHETTWWKTPAGLGSIVLGLVVVLNVIFW